jgi:hypothetical protein
MPSPLDRLYHAPQPVAASTEPRAEVGRLRIHFQQQRNEANCRAAKVTISVASEGRPIYFTGLSAKEVRRGYVTLDIPPLEQWAESLSWLSRAQRERFEEPSFYEMLQREISTRLRR